MVREARDLVTFSGRILFGATVADSISFLGNLPEAMVALGWDVHIASSPPEGEGLELPYGVTFHPLPMSRAPSILMDVQSLLAWLRVLAKVRPSIVSIGTPKASLLGISASWVLRIPRRVYVLRGLRLETSQGIRRMLLGLLERLTARQATHVLAVSPSLSRKYADLRLCSPQKITVIGSGSSHGVNVSRFRPLPSAEVRELKKDMGISSNVPLLGFVGRFSEDKGASTLLHVRRRLVELGIDHEMLTVGRIEGAEEVFRDLNRIGRRIVALPWTENLEGLYPLMTVLLLPTKREGFPNVVLEAASVGVPTITTSVTGAVDSVIDGVTGVLAPPADDEAFFLEVRKLIENPARVRSLGRNARTRVIRSFDEDQVNRNIVDYLHRIS